MAVHWYIQLMGGLTIRVGDRDVRRFRIQKSAALLAYLALHLKQNQGREELMELLWPGSESDKSRKGLRNALLMLRHQLDPTDGKGEPVILATNTHVQLNPSAVTTDV